MAVYARGLCLFTWVSTCQQKQELRSRKGIEVVAGLNLQPGMKTRIHGTIVVSVALICEALCHAQNFSGGEVARRTIERRAVEAAIWGMPIVSFDAMRQAFFRDAGAKYGDILYFSRFADWKFQVTTPNASSLYVYLNFNLKNGPVVLDLRAAAGAGLSGSLNDAWQVPLIDIGPAAEDRAYGGKYLLLPPEYQGSVPDGYIRVQSPTYNGYAVFRSIPATASTPDLEKGLNLVKEMRVYPLEFAENPPESRHIDISSKLFDGIARFDDTFYENLARMVNEENIRDHDFVMTAQLRSLGIEKGTPFKPDPATRAILKRAVAEAHAWFMQSMAAGDRHWPNAHWTVSAPVGPKTGFTFLAADGLYIDERATAFFMTCAPAKQSGAASINVGAYRDSSGELLRGEMMYRLQIPPNAPAKQFWAVTVYDLETAGFIREAPVVAINFYQEPQKNPDGSIDVYFGPVAPAGKESNWIYTEPGKPWFALFGSYGPERAVFDKSWTLGDIEPIAPQTSIIRTPAQPERRF